MLRSMEAGREPGLTIPDPPRTCSELYSNMQMLEPGMKPVKSKDSYLAWIPEEGDYCLCRPACHAVSRKSF
ncbi:hypothetical protein RRG08_065802 [Elysia crispata]|uniref:Uncharacterized protein n=1 Tax=Elysia crispata TaxID=231223 RepID=A0AAE0ZR98_9GAST|nr:hypothetical protein RRG08_065802 [Elysia crispata]